MKLKIFNTTGTATGETDLPSQFSEPVREDLIKKAVLAIQNNNRQAYGPYQEAGQRHAVRISKRRRDYKGSYGKGISRVPRKILSHRGSQFFWVGANAPGTVGGRRAHPPKVETVWKWKLNTKERRKAICSAISATMIKEQVIQRGHLIPLNYPFLISEDAEKINKTKHLLDTLQKLGFENELERASKMRVRAGKGKLRGRRKITRKSLLLVVSDTAEINKAASNIPGMDVINVKKLNAEALAPGGHPGRATLFTTKALDELKKGLFTNTSLRNKK
jgi:large subunit ribosomal protein L4e